MEQMDLKADHLVDLKLLEQMDNQFLEDQQDQMGKHWQEDPKVDHLVDLKLLEQMDNQFLGDQQDQMGNH